MLKVPNRSKRPHAIARKLASVSQKALLLALLSFVISGAYSYTRVGAPVRVEAAVGINHQINFQGKLVNPNGTNVTDGNYSIVFSIYSVSSGGSAIWTETQSPTTVTNGIFQVNLGSVTALPGSVDFNTDNIYLGVKVGADAEMTPRIQFTAVPQAFNAEKLGGLDKTGYIQNGVSQQASSNFNISGAGVVGTSLTTPTLQSAAATALTITGNAASTWSTTAGNLTLQAGSTGDIVINTDADSNLQITATAVPAIDQVAITNAGQAVTTSGVNNLSINFVGGAAAVEAGAQRIDVTPGGTTGGTWNGLRVVQAATGPATGVTTNATKLEGPTTGGAGTYNAINIANIGAVTTAGVVRGINITATNSQAAGTVRGFQLNNLTAGAASEIGLDLGTGWDNLVTYNNGATVLINGTGQWNLAQVTGTLPVANGGTNIASYTTGDLLYASGATTLAKLADVATGSCLISGGVGVAPSWGTCTTGSVTGSGTAGQIAFFNGAGTITSESSGFGWDTTNKLLAIQGAAGQTTQTTASILSSATGLTSGSLLNVTASGAPASSWTGAIATFEHTSADVDVDGSAVKIGLTGAAAGDGTALNVTTAQTGTSAYALRVSDDGTYTDSTSFVVDASGNVGIGTASPTSKLQTQGAAAVAGTGTISSSGTTVTGVGTSFTTELAIGDLITAGGQTRTVASITNNLSLTTGPTASPFNPALPGSTSFTLNKPIANFTDSTGTSGLFVQGGSLSVAIGTLIPQEGGTGLTVRNRAYIGGNTAGQEALIVDQIDGTGAILSVRQNGVEKLKVDNAGNVGIGDNTPDARLDVEPTGAVTANSYAQQINNLQTNVTTDAIDKYGLHISSTGSFTGSGGTATNNYGLFVATPTGADNNYAAVFQGGNVGIGTTSPTTPLQVIGNISTKASAGSSRGLTLESNDGTGVQRLYVSGGGTTDELRLEGYSGATSGLVTLYAGGSERIRVQGSNGNVGIGTTGPTAQLHVATTQPASVGGNGTAGTTALTVAGGAGGDTSGITGQTAGAGSALGLTSGAGGAATGASGTNTGGAGGSVTINTGNGGSATSGIGGAGGTVAVTSGNGGNGTGANANGNGGAITLTGGNGGTGGLNTSGTGGAVTIKGGNGVTTNASGGNVILQGGTEAGGSGTEGSVIVRAQSAGNATSNFIVQNSASAQIFGVDTVNAEVLIGRASTAGKLAVYGSSNRVIITAAAVGADYTLILPTSVGSANQCLKNSGTAGTLTFGVCGNAAGSNTIILVPEYAGAVITPDGSNNSGTMTADYDSASVGHNYYEWSTDQAAAQDYNVVVRYAVPSNFSSFTAGSWKLWTWNSTTTVADSDTTVTVKDEAGTTCTNLNGFSVAQPSANTWNQKTLNDPTGTCTIEADTVITIIFNMKAKTPQTNKIRIGELSFVY